MMRSTCVAGASIAATICSCSVVSDLSCASRSIYASGCGLSILFSATGRRTCAKPSPVSGGACGAAGSGSGAMRSCSVPGNIRRKSPSTSHAHVAGRAPSLSSALLPTEAWESAFPGTAKTSLPCVIASSAKSSAPLFSGASTTTVATARPEVMRLRSRKPKRGTDIFGANSLTTAPQRATLCVHAPAKSRLIAVPDTPTQTPPASSAPSAAERSMPAVRPESTMPP